MNLNSKKIIIIIKVNILKISKISWHFRSKISWCYRDIYIYIIDIFVPTLVLIRARVLAVTRADRQSQQPTLGVACAWEMKRNVRDSQITHRRHTSITKSRSLNPLEFKGNYGAALNIWSWCTGRWWGGAVTFGTARRGMGGVRARPGPSSLYQM